MSVYLVESVFVFSYYQNSEKRYGLDESCMFLMLFQSIGVFVIISDLMNNITAHSFKFMKLVKHTDVMETVLSLETAA